MGRKTQFEYKGIQMEMGENPSGLVGVGNYAA